MSRVYRTVAIAALVGFSVAGCRLFETTDGDVDTGNEALLEGRGEAAAAAYAEAAEDLPESPELNFDRGLAERATGKHEDAARYLLQALDTDTRPFEQKVYAALGANAAKWALELERSEPAPGGDSEAEDTGPSEAVMTRWQSAVDHLEQALLRDPTDEASRRSLEVALLRVDPPCSARDDDLEPNNAIAAAKPIEVAAAAPTQSGVEGPSPEVAKDELGWTKQLMSCPADADWLSIDLNAGDRLSVKLTSAADGGRLALHFVGPDQTQALNKAVSDDEVMTEFDYAVGPSGAGVYYLRVENLDYDEVSYGLEVKVRPSCESTEDRFEKNDSNIHAPTVTPGALNDLKICPKNEDWFSIILAEGESMFVFANVKTEGEEEVTPSVQDADALPSPLQIEILTEAGQSMAKGAPSGASARVSTLLNPGPGYYQIRVTGNATLEARYDLIIQVVPPCPEGDDAHEDNDISEDAVDILTAAAPETGAGRGTGASGTAVASQKSGPPTLFARVCPGDEDWYSYTHDGDKPAVLSAIFEHDKGDLRLELFDDTGTDQISSSDVSSTTRNGEAVVIEPMTPDPDVVDLNDPADPDDPDDPDDGPIAQTFKIRLSGDAQTENFYILRLDQPSPNSDESDQSDNPDEQPPEDDEDKKDPEDNKDDQDNKDDSDKQDEQEPEEQQQPPPDWLDKLDENPDNLEAREAERQSPLSGHRPRKDW